MRREQFVESLMQDTANSLRITSQSYYGIRNATRLYLRRANEGRLSSETVSELFAVAQDCVLNRAGLCDAAEQTAIEALEHFMFAGGDRD